MEGVRDRRSWFAKYRLEVTTLLVTFGLLVLGSVLWGVADTMDTTSKYTPPAPAASDGSDAVSGSPGLKRPVPEAAPVVP
jgi:hypothetical protein